MSQSRHRTSLGVFTGCRKEIAIPRKIAIMSQERMSRDVQVPRHPRCGYTRPADPPGPHDTLWSNVERCYRYSDGVSSVHQSWARCLFYRFASTTMPVVSLGFLKGTWSALTESPAVCTLGVCLFSVAFRRLTWCRVPPPSAPHHGTIRRKLHRLPLAARPRKIPTLHHIRTCVTVSAEVLELSSSTAIRHDIYCVVLLTCFSSAHRRGKSFDQQKRKHKGLCFFRRGRNWMNRLWGIGSSCCSFRLIVPCPHHRPPPLVCGIE